MKLEQMMDVMDGFDSITNGREEFGASGESAGFNGTMEWLEPGPDGKPIASLLVTLKDSIVTEVGRRDAAAIAAAQAQAEAASSAASVESEPPATSLPPLVVRGARAPGELRRFEGHAGPVQSVAFVKNGRWAISAAGDQSVRIWDVEGGHEVTKTEAPELVARSEAPLSDARRPVDGALAVSPNGDVLFAAGGRGNAAKIRQWVVPAAAFTEKMPIERSMLFPPDVDPLLVPIVTDNLFYTSLALTPDGRWLVFGDSQGGLGRWDLTQGIAGPPLKPFADPRSKPGSVLAIAVSPDGRRIATAGGLKAGSGEPTNAMVHLWDLESGREIARFYGHERDVTCLAFAANGRGLISGSQDKTLRLWSADVPSPAGEQPLIETRAEIGRLDGHADTVSCVTVTPDGKVGISGSWDGTIRFWDLRTGAELHRFELAAGSHELDEGLTFLYRQGCKVHSVAVSSDGRLLLSGSGYVFSLADAAIPLTVNVDCTVRIWKVPDLDRSAPPAPAPASQPAPAAASESEPWIESGPIPFDPPLKFTNSSRFAFAPAGGRLLFSSTPERFSVIDTMTGKEVKTLEAAKEHGPLASLAITAHGDVAMTGMKPGGKEKFDVLFWDLADGVVSGGHGHRSAVTAVAISANGNFGLSRGANGSLVFWNSGRVAGRLPKVDDPNGQLAVATNAPSALVWSGRGDQELHLYNLGQQRQILHINNKTEPYVGRITAAALSLDGARLVVAVAKRTQTAREVESHLYLVEPVSGEAPSELGGNQGLSMGGEIESLSFSPDGRYLASAMSGAGDHRLSLWDLESRRQVWSVAHTSEWLAIGFSAESDALHAVASEGVSTWRRP